MRIMEKYNYKNICITNRSLVTGDYLEYIKRVASTDVDAIILREKDLTKTEYKELAEKVLAICEEYHTTCILHYFYDVAMELGWKNIHLPMNILVELAPEERGYFNILGASTHSVEEAITAEKLGATYVTASHIFETNCKAGLAPKGLSFLTQVVNSVSIPVYALGGIHKPQVLFCIEAGASGVCMMSDYTRN
jgi:thiamine-phosphate pyrophosphorylase